MKTDKQIMMDFLDTYKMEKGIEEAKRKVWYALFEEWEEGGFADDELGDQVEAASREHKKARERTNMCARMVANYILKEQDASLKKSN